MSDRNDDATDAAYTRLLVGKWQGDETSKPMDWHHITIFNADGTWLGFGAGEKNGVFQPFFNSGTWSVKASCVSLKVEESPMMPSLVGQELSYVTLSVDANAWVWKTSAGSVITSRRFGKS
ncbi:uncharacterized protein SOCE26_050470 [Sorangium cellulosum]|uniref:DUF1579 domain-containing protein n=1 Tax=Sorangium cellulosum TaxID=56 RepID=A0A2L0EWC4_SORCE|nr:hypothetical protein [Sorangium cellulosum]AUX43597.1 uncharacterized protein SOCE26_050470 [Sorangium cellulosum]